MSDESKVIIDGVEFPIDSEVACLIENISLDRDACKAQIVKMRAQWYHSIHRDKCLELLGENNE